LWLLISPSNHSEGFIPENLLEDAVFLWSKIPFTHYQWPLSQLRTNDWFPSSLYLLFHRFPLFRWN
jgi:hypothetical protein